MPRQIIIAFFLSILTSCSTNYLITVRQDGSATVSIDRDYDLTDINRYYRSDIISNIDTNTSLGARVTFEISNIDSLGYYLPFHPPGFFRFIKKGNTLTVSDGHTDAFKENDRFCCTVYMRITFNKTIQDLKSVNRRIKKVDDRTVQIVRTRRQLIKGKKKINLTIKLE